RACRPHGRRGRLRLARAPLRPRVPARQLHLAAHEPADRRVRRLPREPDALPPRGLRRRARRLARAQAHVRPDLGRGLEARRRGLRRGRTHRPGLQGPRVRRHRRLRGPDRVGPAARVRPALPDAVQRPGPPRGRDPDHGGGQHLVLHRREHDPGRRPRGPGAPRPRAPLGPVLDPPRGLRAGVGAALAAPVRHAEPLHAEVRLTGCDVAAPSFPAAPPAPRPGRPRGSDAGRTAVVRPALRRAGAPCTARLTAARAVYGVADPRGGPRRATRPPTAERFSAGAGRPTGGRRPSPTASPSPRPPRRAGLAPVAARDYVRRELLQPETDGPCPLRTAATCGSMSSSTSRRRSPTDRSTTRCSSSSSTRSTSSGSRRSSTRWTTSSGSSPLTTPRAPGTP